MKSTRATTQHPQDMAKENVNGAAFLLLSLSDLRISSAPWEPLEQKEFLWVLLRYPELEEGWHFRRFYTKDLQCFCSLIEHYGNYQCVCSRQGGNYLRGRSESVFQSSSLPWDRLLTKSPDTHGLTWSCPLLTHGDRRCMAPTVPKL